MRKLFLCVFVLIALASCRAKKTDKHETTEILKTEGKSATVDETAKETATANNVQVVTNSDLHENISGFTIDPIDPKKPVEITTPDGKTTTVKNGSINYSSHDKTDKTTKTETDKTTTQATETGKKTTNDEFAGELYKNDTEAHADIKPALWPYALGFLLLILLYLVYRNRKKIPWLKNMFAQS